jgi:hypothetical protein
MRTYDLEDMVDTESGSYETSKHNLLTQLREGSEFLEVQKEELSYIWTEYKPRIVSFYELVKTPTVEKLKVQPQPPLNLSDAANSLQSDSDIYPRGDQESEIVKRFSAQLYLPIEERVPVEANHMNMIKFASAQDRTYRIVVRYVQGWVDSITESCGM